MKNIFISLCFTLFLLIATDINMKESSFMFLIFFIALNVMKILDAIKKEQPTDEESLRAIYERDRLLAALKQMQESNPGVLTFAIKSAAEIKKARAAWVNASAVIAEVEKANEK
jgi:uncharacterized protein YciI